MKANKLDTFISDFEQYSKDMIELAQGFNSLENILDNFQELDVNSIFANFGVFSKKYKHGTFDKIVVGNAISLFKEKFPNLYFHTHENNTVVISVAENNSPIKLHVSLKNKSYHYSYTLENHELQRNLRASIKNIDFLEKKLKLLIYKEAILQGFLGNIKRIFSTKQNFSISLIYEKLLFESATREKYLQDMANLNKIIFNQKTALSDVILLLKSCDFEDSTKDSNYGYSFSYGAELYNIEKEIQDIEFRPDFVKIKNRAEEIIKNYPCLQKKS